MTAKSIADRLIRHPFIPMKVTLDDGENFYIATELRAVIDEDKLIFGWSKDPFAPPEERKLRIIPVSRVRDMKDVDPSRLHRRK